MVNIRTFVFGDPNALPRSYSPSDFAPGEQHRRWLATQPLGRRIRSILRSARLDLSYAIHERVDYRVWQYRLAQERRNPTPSYGRYEQNSSVLIAEFLDNSLDWAIAEGGDTEAIGWYLAIFPSMPWQRRDDATRYGLWTSEHGFRTVQRFDNHAHALSALSDLEQQLAITDEEVDR